MLLYNMYMRESLFLRWKCTSFRLLPCVRFCLVGEAECYGTLHQASEKLRLSNEPLSRRRLHEVAPERLVGCARMRYIMAANNTTI